MDKSLSQSFKCSYAELECNFCFIIYKPSRADGWQSTYDAFAANKNKHNVKWQLMTDFSSVPLRKSGKCAILPCIFLKLVSADDELVRFKWEILAGESDQELDRVLSTGIIAMKPGNIRRGCFLPEMKKDSLRIIVKITMIECSQPQKDIVTRDSDIGKLFNDMEFSDATIIAGDSKFPVHKNILALRSDVFAAMFRHELEEKKTNQIVIDDFDSSVIKEMLCYIYTGQSSEISKMAAELLTAADKYAVEGLKEECILELNSNLTIETAVPTLISADLYSAERLKQHAIDFISTCSEDIIKTDAFRDMVKKYPHIALDFIEGMQKYFTQIPLK